MFTVNERNDLRAKLTELGKQDARVTGIAITGSASGNREDDWSDIDLAFGIDGHIESLMAVFTTFLLQRGAVDFFDVPSGPWIYRVFLLGSTLQVDLAFVPQREFGARAKTFLLVHGEANEVPQTVATDARGLVGWAWLYALHVRSSLARGRLWQAAYMLNCMRDQVVSLLCQRYELPTKEGRGVDQLPAEVIDRLVETWPGKVNADDLVRAFHCLLQTLAAEIGSDSEKLKATILGLGSFVSSGEPKH